MSIRGKSARVKPVAEGDAPRVGPRFFAMTMGMLRLHRPLALGLLAATLAAVLLPTLAAGHGWAAPMPHPAILTGLFLLGLALLLARVRSSAPRAEVPLALLCVLFCALLLAEAHGGLVRGPAALGAEWVAQAGPDVRPLTMPAVIALALQASALVLRRHLPEAAVYLVLASFLPLTLNVAARLTGIVAGPVEIDAVTGLLLAWSAQTALALMARIDVLRPILLDTVHAKLARIQLLVGVCVVWGLLAVFGRGLSVRDAVPVASLVVAVVWLITLMVFSSARHVEAADRKRRLLERALERQAGQDPLTGIVNRRGGMVQGARLIRRRAPDAGLGVILADIDRFKSINDRWGHEQGDEVLIRVAEALGQAMRGGDLLARWGGEEFLILLPDVDENGLFEAAQRLRVAVASRVALPERRAVTISMGCTLLGPQETSLTQAIARADGALYRAKGAGRNRVLMAQGVPQCAQQAAAKLPVPLPDRVPRSVSS